MMAASTPVAAAAAATAATTTTTTTTLQQQQPSGSPNIQVEFAVNVNKPDDLDKIEQLLEDDGYKLLSSDFESKTVKLELENGANKQVRSVQQLQDSIERRTGFLAVIKGVGELASAVSELRPSQDAIRNNQSAFHGVVRLSQLDNNLCYVDGSIGNGQYDLSRSHLLSLAIHEFGNLDHDKYESIGDPIVDLAKKNMSDATGFSVSRIVPDCNVAEMIGRSIALTRVSLESEDRTVLSAGVVARASTVQKNTKQVCSCSGKTLWEERVDRKRDDEQQKRQQQ